MADSQPLRCSINIPNFGDFADPATVAQVASAAEAAGWDGLFVWDHIVYDKAAPERLGDPWMLLTAAALATTRIRLGTLLTPVARRRPQLLARQVATLDNLSGGRVILGAGLGAPIADEYGSFGEPTDPKVLAARLDEGLEVLDRFWSGESVTHRGSHYLVDEVALLPSPVQRPRVPVWIGGYWPRRPPMRRAARWDGAVPLFLSADHGHAPPVDEVRELVSFVSDHRRGHRHGHLGDQFEIVIGGASPEAARADACAADAKGSYARVELYREVNCVRPSVESTPPVRVTRKAGPVSALLSSLR